MLKLLILFFSSNVFATLDSSFLRLPASASGFYPTKIYNVLYYGAKPDNSTVNTNAINQAIEDANFYGGGFVLFPPGVYYTGSILLKSNVYLYLENGASIQASNNVADYPYDWDLWDVIHAENVANCGIIGEGLNSIVSGPMW